MMLTGRDGSLDYCKGCWCMPNVLASSQLPKLQSSLGPEAADTYTHCLSCQQSYTSHLTTHTHTTAPRVVSAVSPWHCCTKQEASTAAKRLAYSQVVRHVVLCRAHAAYKRNGHHSRVQPTTAQCCMRGQHPQSHTEHDASQIEPDQHTEQKSLGKGACCKRPTQQSLSGRHSSLSVPLAPSYPNRSGKHSTVTTQAETCTHIQTQAESRTHSDNTATAHQVACR